MLLWQAAVALTSISNCWFDWCLELPMHGSHSNPNHRPEQTHWANRQGCCQDLRVGLVYASKAQRMGQRAGPFLSKCRDECVWMEMNGTRNINSSYLSVLYPCSDLFLSSLACSHGSLLPCWARLSPWPLYTLFSQYVTQRINTLTQSTDCTSVHISFFSGWILLTLLLPGICLTDLWPMCTSHISTSDWILTVCTQSRFFDDISCVQIISAYLP